MTMRPLARNLVHAKRDGRPGPDPRHAGFSLVEMLVVLVIIGLIMGLVGPQVLTFLTDARSKSARLQVEGFANALDLYYIDVGQYPAGRDGLSALLERPTGAKVWNGPYLKGNAVPNDPWGNPYVYRAPGSHGPYDLLSYGSDGQEGGSESAADIASWDK